VIIPVFMMGAIPFLLYFTLGVRSRDGSVRTMAFAAAVLVLATLVCWWAMARGELPGAGRPAAWRWLIAMAFSFTFAIVLGFVAWRRFEKTNATWAPSLILGFASWILLAMLVGSASMLSPAVHELYVRVTPSVLRAEMVLVAPFAMLIAWVASIWHAIVDPVEHEPPKWLIVAGLLILPGLGAVSYYFIVVFRLNLARRESPVEPRSRMP
jgi:hypothetical protein